MMTKVPLVNLNNTELKVSKLGFAPFDIAVSSRKISPEEGGRILAEAYKYGVNYWDTSDDYGTHPHIASGIKQVPREEVVISTKTYARSGKEAEKRLRNSLKELETEYVDIFLLHFVQADWTKRCRQVLKDLRDIKKTGLVRVVGLSTHSVAVVKEASEFEEVDVIMTICCNTDQKIIDKFPQHIPLEDGSIDEMLHALNLAHKNGKGVIAMKVLGSACPPLVKNYQSAIRAILRLDFVDTMVVGVRSLDEVEKNVKAVLSG
jgi:aryl-alcohol dehydrogenase-like predicted oxidoreductase